MEIKFVKVSPTQNMTILVESPLPREQQHTVASKLLQYDHIYAEQVGYIEQPVDSRAAARLQMMGGEFCGNATMSLGAYLVWQKNLPTGSVEAVLLEVSGAEALLSCTITVEKDGLKGKVKMPSVEKIESIVLSVDSKEFPAHKVFMPGINHYIIKEQYVDLANQTGIDALLAQLEIGEKVDAIGLLFWNETTNYINPLVYVIPTQSKVWERGCGSGSASLGAFLATQSTDHTFKITQPGGSITVYTGAEGSVWIEGTVKIVAKGVAYL